MTKSQVNTLARCLMAVCALLLAGVSIQANAQLPGPHPDYLHAIRDLRQARGILKYDFGNPAHNAAANAAIEQISSAISDLKTASHLDEKNFAEMPPQKTMPQEGRFHAVEALLDSAFNDTNREEADTTARATKDRALGHIDNARNTIRPLL